MKKYKIFQEFAWCEMRLRGYRAFSVKQPNIRDVNIVLYEAADVFSLTSTDWSLTTDIIYSVFNLSLKWLQLNVSNAQYIY
jgi:hypothetical protein